MSVKGGMGELLRASWRAIAASPAAAISLTLAIGASTAIFAVVNTVLLRPLPYGDAGRLVRIWDHNRDAPAPKQLLSPAALLDYRRLEVFDDVAAWWQPDAIVTDAGMDPRRIRVVQATGNLFRLLQVAPVLGQGFPAEGPLFSPEQLCVISFELWRDRYGSDPAIIGRPLQLSGEAYMVVGVMPQGFAFPSAVDAWTRLTWDPAPLSRGIHIFNGIARLRPDAALDSANAALSALSERLAREHPSSNRRWHSFARPLLDEEVGFYAQALYVMAASGGLLLVAACLNVAGLVAVSGVARAREFATRLALGATRTQILLRLASEAAVLAAVSTAVAGLLAWSSLRWVVAHLPTPVPRLDELALNVKDLVRGGLIGFCTAIVFSVIPAWFTSRVAPTEVLRKVSRASSAVTTHLTSLVVLAEIAFACCVLVVAVVMARSVHALQSLDIGVEASGVLTMEVRPEGLRYDDWEATRLFHAAVVDRLNETAGITAAGAAGTLPLQTAFKMRYTRPDRPTPPADPVTPVQHISVDVGYFETTRARMAAGRSFARSDNRLGEPVMIINESMAQLVFPGENPIDHFLTPSAVGIGPFGYNFPGRVPFRIVGVVADLHQTQLQSPNEPVMYFSQRQFPTKTMYVTVRGEGANADVLRDAVKAVDPTVAPGRIQPLSDYLSEPAAPARLLFVVAAVFAALLTAIAGTGVYSLLHRTIALGTREYAIRHALGATAGTLAWRALRKTFGLTLAALVPGLGLGWAAVLGLGSLTFGSNSTSAGVFVVVPVTILVVTGLACAGPLRRLFSADHLGGLRPE